MTLQFTFNQLLDLELKYKNAPEVLELIQYAKEEVPRARTAFHITSLEDENEELLTRVRELQAALAQTEGVS